MWFHAYQEIGYRFFLISLQTFLVGIIVKFLFAYQKPLAEVTELCTGEMLCAVSDRSGNLADYNQDDEYNFFNGL